MITKPKVDAFFEPQTSTITYVVSDPSTGICAIIDPVLDFDPRSGRVADHSVETVMDFVREHRLELRWILDTHIHADHMSGLNVARRRLGGLTGIGDRVREVQACFADFYHLGADFPRDGSQFDHLFADDEEFRVGELKAKALHVPGHTPACTAYLIGDCLFVGDTVLMPDFGTARCDFPGGNAATLYQSVRHLLALAPATRLFVGHDYGPGDRAIAWETTVAAQRAGNIHVRDGIGEAEFVQMRTARDASLDMPALMLPAVQVNIRAGQLPEPEDNAISYLKIPLTH